MDKIKILGLRLSVYVGTLPWEKRRRQTILADLEMDLDLSRAAATDNLKETIDYAAVAEAAKKVAASKKRDLLEALAGDIAREVAARFPVEGVKVLLRKRALKGADFTAVELNTSRKNSPSPTGGPQ